MVRHTTKPRLLRHILPARRGAVRWPEADLSAETLPVDQAWFAAAVRMMKPAPEVVRADDLQPGVSRIPPESQAT